MKVQRRGEMVIYDLETKQMLETGVFRSWGSYMQRLFCKGKICIWGGVMVCACTAFTNLTMRNALAKLILKRRAETE